MFPLTYDINFIMELSKNISDKNLNNDVENYLNNILIDIKKPLNNSGPVFKNNNSYNKNTKNARHFKNNRRQPTFNKHLNVTDKTFIGKGDVNKDEVNKVQVNKVQVNKDSVDKDSLDKDAVDKDAVDKDALDKDDVNKVRVNKDDINKDDIDKLPVLSYRISRMCYINSKSDYDMIITNIRKILNKITEQTYQKLKNEFLCYYKSIYNDVNNDELNRINLYIFDSLVYNNILFNNLYSDLLNDLITIDPKFSHLLNDNLEIFYNIYRYLELPVSRDYEEISKNNKHNDRNKCLCGFYIFCIKINLIPEIHALDAIANLQKELMINIKLESKKEYNELVSQFIFFVVSNISLRGKEKELVKNIEYISGLKSNSFPGISNKIIFKHKDMVEKEIRYCQ